MKYPVSQLKSQPSPHPHTSTSSETEKRNLEIWPTSNQIEIVKYNQTNSKLLCNLTKKEKEKEKKTLA